MARGERQTSKPTSETQTKARRRKAVAVPAVATEVLTNGVVAEQPPPPSKVLVIDIGGSKVKMLATGETEPRKMPSGKSLTPASLVEGVRKLAEGWQYEAISLGYPGQVGQHGPRSEPGNLGPGWVGFDFAAAFECPVRMVNDAAMQALGSYEGGRMLFLGLGTGLGTALISDNVVITLELGELWFNGKKSLGETIGRRGLKRIGKQAWRSAVERTVASLLSAFAADYVVLGGGNAKKLKNLIPGTRRGHNLTAFRGGFRLWNLENVLTHDVDGPEPSARQPVAWRLI